jgi:hypothetical protein
MRRVPLPDLCGNLKSARVGPILRLPTICGNALRAQILGWAFVMSAIKWMHLAAYATSLVNRQLLRQTDVSERSGRLHERGG